MSGDGGFGSDTAEQVMVRPKAKPRSETQSKQLPPYAVIIHNDDLNTFDFVIEVLMKVLKFTLEKAVQHTLEAHHTGRSIVWSGSLELAELKADQIRSCGADPVAKANGAQPLQVSIEAQ